MLELLNSIDHVIFFFINVTLSNPVTDWSMPVITSDNLLRILYGVAMVGLMWKGSPRLRWLVLFSLLALLMADQLSSHLLKPWIARPRPCHVLTEINLLVGCGGGYAMPSSHATNAFAQAMMFTLCVKRIGPYLFAFAALVAISRVFVGVHYPGDILAGALVGSAVGVAVAFVFVHFDRRTSRSTKSR